MKQKETVYIEAYAPVECAAAEKSEEFYQQLAEDIANQANCWEDNTNGSFNAQRQGWVSRNTNGNGRLLGKLIEVTRMELMRNKEITFLGRNGNPLA